jgi:putative phosphatase
MSASHILLGVSLGFHHRHALARVLRETARDSTILTLDPVLLKAHGITTLALDFDGVLSPHGSAAPLPEAREWLVRCSAVFGEAGMFILSNKPTEERRAWFRRHFPGMRLISGVRKKPFPDGLKQISNLAGVPLASILMVDDRLLTGCLGALGAGARPAYIRSPYSSLRQRPFSELFFMLLRKGERIFIRLIA